MGHPEISNSRELIASLGWEGQREKQVLSELRSQARKGGASSRKKVTAREAA